jgi:hypothetical protein
MLHQTEAILRIVLTFRTDRDGIPSPTLRTTIQILAARLEIYSLIKRDYSLNSFPKTIP